MSEEESNPMEMVMECLMGCLAGCIGGGDQPPPQKKALLIGLNYAQSSSALKGCINDVAHQNKMLTEQMGFSQQDILVLVDDSQIPNLLPSKANIVEGLNWLINGSNPGDMLYFAYSGHGTQVNDSTGQYGGGFMEGLCPLDIVHATDESSFMQALLTDREFNEILKQLQPGVNFLSFIDACHSGTIQNLHYQYDAESRAVGEIGANGIPVRGMQMPSPPPLSSKRFLNPPAGLIAHMGRDVNPGFTRTSFCPNPNEEWLSDKNIVCLSGCKENQVSYDCFLDNESQGAFTWSCMKVLEQNNYQPIGYQDLINGAMQELKLRSYPQEPSVSASSEGVLQQGQYLQPAPQ